MVNQDIVNQLMGLGLTKYEAVTYLVLLEKGQLTARRISNLTNIPYPKVYEIMNGLARKGLVSMTTNSPVKCVAIMPDKAFNAIKKEFEERINLVLKLIRKHIKTRESISDIVILCSPLSIKTKIVEIVNKSKNTTIYCNGDNSELFSRLGIKRKIKTKKINEDFCIVANGKEHLIIEEFRKSFVGLEPYKAIYFYGSKALNYLISK